MASPHTPAGRRSALVTPEAVTVDLPLADLGSRTLAILIDLMVLGGLAYFVAFLGVAAVGVAGAAAGVPEWLIVVTVLVLNFAVLFGAPVASETLWRGRTPGKGALGLRVVTTDGGPVRLRHAAIRWLLALVELFAFLGIPAIITSMVTRRGQRLGDLAAGTVVIRDRDRRHGADVPVQWQIPPVLAGYAATLDTSGLTPQDYSLVRSFLLRADTFDPATRQHVAQEVATTVAARMNHNPAPGTHPEALLLCTAALMQQRDRTPVPEEAPPRDPFAPSPW